MDWKFIWRHNDQLVDPDQLNPGDVLYYVDTTSLTASVKAKRTQDSVQLTNLTVENGDIIVTVEPIDDRYESSQNMFDVFSNIMTDSFAG